MQLLSDMIRKARATLPRPLPIQNIGSLWDMYVYIADVNGAPVEAVASIVDVDDPNNPGTTIKALMIAPVPAA